jgi:hypothetical protein
MQIRLIRVREEASGGSCGNSYHISSGYRLLEDSAAIVSQLVVNSTSTCDARHSGRAV